MAKARKPRAARKPRRPKGLVRQQSERRLRRAVLAAFWVSGFAGLMHQVVWAKLLVGLIGATAYAQTAVLVVFMGGLALGAVVLGRGADRGWRPLRSYVVLELAIASFCLVLPFLLWALGLGYAALGSLFFESAGLKLLLRFSLAVFAVLLPAVLMGGTLPILARSLIGRVEETRHQVASLYAINSFGAVVGAGVAGFATLPWLGVHGSLVLASLLNVAAAGLVWKHARRETREAAKLLAEAEPEAAASSYGRVQSLVTLIALGLSGFAAMGYEVLFTRVIGLAFGSSTYSFTVMLMAFITGIALGSAIISRVRVRRPLWLLGLSQLAVSVALVAITPLVARLPYLIGLVRIELIQQQGGFELYQLAKAALCLMVLLVPTTCLGMSFPLVAQVQARQPRDIGQRVGTTYAFNTVGNVLGASLTTLVLLPSLGLLGAFHFNLALNLLAGLSILVVAREVAPAFRLAMGMATALAGVMYAAAGTRWTEPINFADAHLRMTTGPAADADEQTRAQHPSSSFQAWTKKFLLDPEKANAYVFEEDSHTTVLAYDDGNQVVLYVNGKPDASTHRDLTTQLFLAHAPLFSLPDARSLLVIGFGSGITAGSALLHGAERLDIVEISDGVLKADPLFAPFNYRVLEDPRVHVYVDDGLGFLRTTPRKYDVVISEPSNPWIAGVGGLFTREFFESVQGRLNPGGVATVWFHQYEQSNETVELVLRTLANVFPHVWLFRSPTYADIIAVASAEPLVADFAAMENRFDEIAIRNDLARVGIPNLASLLAHHAVSEARFQGAIPAGPLNTVAHPRLEHAAPRNFFRRTSADLVQRLDPLRNGQIEASDVLLDRYARYREQQGEPIRWSELSYIADSSKEPTARALEARTQKDDSPPSRPARGRLSEPEEMGRYEAGFWSKRLSRSGRSALSARYYRRFLDLSQREAGEPAAREASD